MSRTKIIILLVSLLLIVAIVFIALNVEAPASLEEPYQVLEDLSLAPTAVYEQLISASVYHGYWLSEAIDNRRYGIISMGDGLTEGFALELQYIMPMEDTLRVVVREIIPQQVKQQVAFPPHIAIELAKDFTDIEVVTTKVEHYPDSRKLQPTQPIIGGYQGLGGDNLIVVETVKGQYSWGYSLQLRPFFEGHNQLNLRLREHQNVFLQRYTDISGQVVINNIEPLVIKEQALQELPLEFVAVEEVINEEAEGAESEYYLKAEAIYNPFPAKGVSFTESVLLIIQVVEEEHIMALSELSEGEQMTVDIRSADKGTYVLEAVTVKVTQ